MVDARLLRKKATSFVFDKAAKFFRCDANGKWTATPYLSSAVPELWFCSSGGVCVRMRVCSEPLYL